MSEPMDIQNDPTDLPSYTLAGELNRRAIAAIEQGDQETAARCARAAAEAMELSP